MGLGHFAAPWTVPADEALGRHEIRWYATLSSRSAEVSWVRPFDVVGSALTVLGQEPYALISDVRVEGVGPSVSDRRILEKLVEASRSLSI